MSTDAALVNEEWPISCDRCGGRFADEEQKKIHDEHSLCGKRSR